MKASLLLLPFCALLNILFLALPEARAGQAGLLLLEHPTQYVEFDYNYLGLRDSTQGGASTTSDQNRLSPSYFISVPFAIFNPDIFLGDVNLRVKYEEDFFSSSKGLSQENSDTNLYYGVAGTFLRKKLFTFSFYANSQNIWQQEEFTPGYDETNTNYGGEADYKNARFPVKVRYDHNGSEYTSLSGLQSYDNDTLSIQTSNSFRNFMETDLSLQDRWIQNSNAAALPVYSLNEITASLNNSVWWKFGPNTPGYLTSNLTYLDSTGDQPLTSSQITETVTQSLGKALKSGASYGYSVQESPQESTHAQSGNFWLSHQLFQSLRTQINLQGTSNQFGDGSQTQVTGTGTLIYQKQLPNDSTLQLQVSDSYQWNDQEVLNSVRTQFNETIKVTDISLRYLLANRNVLTISEVWNKDHTVRFTDPADFGTYVFGNMTYITINPTGQIHTGDVLLVTYQYSLDTDLTFAANTVSTSGNLSLYGNLLSIFAQYSDTQQHLLGGSDAYAMLGNARTASVGAQSNLANQTIGVQYISTNNPSINEDSLNAYWWYTGVFGNNQLKLTIADTYNSWVDNSTSVRAHENALNASATVIRQFSRSSQGSLAGGYIRSDGSTNQRSAYVKLTYSYILGKLHFWATAQSLLNDYSNQSLMNNTINLIVRRYF
jgi:hypothetical protein